MSRIDTTIAPIDERYAELSDRALRAAVKYNRLNSEALMKKVFEETRRLENGESTSPDLLVRLFADYRTSAQHFLTAWLVARQRNLSLK